MRARLDRIKAFLSHLTGRRRLLIAFLLGAVSALAFPPFFATPLLWLVYPCLLWMLQGAGTHRQAFGIAWAFGVGQFGLAFYWLTNSMFTDIAHWWWAVPFASTILPILLGFIPGFATMMWWRMRLSGFAAVLGFAAWFMVGEWIRGHFLTGFPWNLTGQGWIGWVPVLQSFSFLGAYGLGLLTIVAASLPVMLTDPAYGRRKALLTVLAGIAVFAGLAAWGQARLDALATDPVPDITIRLVQPNIPQGEKWSRDLARRHFETLLDLSNKPGEKTPTVFIWPETAVPYPLDMSVEIPRAIASVLQPGGLVITGALREEGKSYFNSLEIVDSSGNRLGHYDKTHLAPFGEYMPFRQVLHLDSLAAGIDLTPGQGPVTLHPAGSLPSFSPMICYEAIFPELVTDSADRPGWLLQITNDGWFGISPGPHQHFAMARARAVEQGLPLLRAANTGISGAVDPYGRIIARLGLGDQGTLDVQLPPRLSRRPFYANYGDIVFAICEALILGICLLKTGAGKNLLSDR